MMARSDMMCEGGVIGVDDIEGWVAHGMALLEVLDGAGGTL